MPRITDLPPEPFFTKPRLMYFVLMAVVLAILAALGAPRWIIYGTFSGSLVTSGYYSSMLFGRWGRVDAGGLSEEEQKRISLEIKAERDAESIRERSLKRTIKPQPRDTDV